MTRHSVTVLGAGMMGDLHANVVASHHGATLRSVVDLDAEQAQAMAEQYGVTATTDVDAALSETDACIIATPEPTHADLFEREGRTVQETVPRPNRHTLISSNGPSTLGVPCCSKSPSPPTATTWIESRR
jgi:threonine dehydrogenase-like Zn-dependent dehydrogenase